MRPMARKQMETSLLWRFCRRPPRGGQPVFKAALHKCIGGALRKFCAIHALQFFEIHPVFLQNCAFV